MANEVIYKHPNSAITLTYDATEDLPTDSTITAGSGYTLTGSDGLTSTGLTITASQSSMTLSLAVSGGTDGEDYLVTEKAIGTTSGKTTVKVTEVRVRSNRGIGNF